MQSRSGAWRLVLSMCAVAPVAVLPPHVHALPTGGQIAAGNVSITQAGNTMTLQQGSTHAVVNWQSFNIGAGEQVNIRQNGAAAAMLARVIGNDPSQLLGSLKADGKLFLINRNGIVVGEGAIIDTAAFLASTLDVADADFLQNGPLTLKGNSAAGVVNLGTITAREGNVLLLAHTVKNAGEISAPKGTAALGAGTEVFLASPDSPTFTIKMNLPASDAAIGVENSGVITAAQAELKAAGGSIYDLAINHSGVVQANGVTTTPDGRVWITAEGGTVGVSGQVTARDAGGDGGEVLIGGDYRGANAAISNAARTVVTESASIDASAATPSGDAGRVIVWADDSTRFLGTLTARGASGGFAEVSGKQFLDFRPKELLDLGPGGTLLLDPTLLRIWAAADNGLSQTPGDPFVFGGSVGSGSILTPATLEAQLAISNVTLDTSTSFGDIVFLSSVTWNSTNTLRVTSGDSIAIDPGVTISGVNATLELLAGKRGVTYSQFDGSYLPINGNTYLASGSTIAVNKLVVGQNTGAAVIGDTLYDDPIQSGNTTFDGVLDVGTLEIDVNTNSGILTATNAGNRIGTLRTTGTGGRITGLDVFDGADDLAVSLQLLELPPVNVRVVTQGNLTLAADTRIDFADPNRDLVFAAIEGAFINAGDASVFGPNVRHLIYSSTAAATGKGGLGGINVGHHPYDPDETFDDTTSRFFFTGAAPITANLTYSANDLSRFYGDANPTFTYSVTGFIDELADDVTGAPELSSSPTVTSGVGSYTITISQGTLDSENYGFVFVPGTLQVTPAPVTIAVDPATRVYGHANPDFSGHYVSGLKNGDAESALGTFSFSTTAIAKSNVGDYAINGSASGGSGNYAVTFTPGTLSITKAPLTVTVADASRIYGAANPNFTASASGLMNSDSLEQAVPDLTFGTTAVAKSNVGHYSITASGSSSNYAPTFVPGTLSITPASLLITANHASRLYGDSNPSFSATYSGLVNGDTSAVVSQLAFSTNATFASGVGTYSITPYDAVATNYTISYAAGTLTVTKAPLTVSIADATRPYGHGDPEFTLGAIIGLKNGDTSDVIQNLTFTAQPPPNPFPGSHSAILASGTAANYDITWFAGTLSIVKAPATIGVNSAQKTYGDGLANLTPFYFGFLPVDEATARDNWRLSNPDALKIDAGSYPLNFVSQNEGVAAALSGLYDITFQPGTLTVLPASLTIRPEDATRLYGDPDPAFRVSISGFKFNEAESILSGLVIASDATAASNVGTYTITASGAVSPNYTVSYLPGTLTIDKAPLLVEAADISRLYGDENPTFSANFSGLKNGDTAAALTGLTFSTTATAASPIGVYTISVGGASATNYALSYESGELRVLHAPLLVKLADATRVYGDENPAFTFESVTGFKNGDTMSLLAGLTPEASVTAQTPAGAHRVITVAADFVGNYQLEVVPGTLTITKAPLVVQAASVSRLYGDANPTFSANFSGFKNGDTAAALSGLTFSTPATTVSPVGVYDISVGGATSSNYTLSYESGELRVLHAPLLVKLADATRTYGDENPAFTFESATGFKNGDTMSLLAGLTPEADVTAQTPVGAYQVTVAADVVGNYQLEVVPGTLTITKAPLTLSGLALNSIYGNIPPTLGYFVTGLRNGDLPTVLEGVNIGTQFFSNTLPGVHDYGFQSTGTAQNYEVTTVIPGRLTVDRRPVIVTAPQVETMRGANPPLSSMFTVQGQVLGGPPFSVEATIGTLSAGVFRPVTYRTTTPRGNYVIRPKIVPHSGTSLGEIEAAYAFALVDGVLKIEDPPVDDTAFTFSIDPSSLNFGDGEIIIEGVNEDTRGQVQDEIAAKTEQLQRDLEAQRTNSEIKVGISRSGDLPLTSAVFAQAAEDLGDELFSELRDFLASKRDESSSYTEAEQEILDILARAESGQMSRGEFYALMETHAGLRWVVSSTIVESLETALKNGDTLSAAQASLVARVSNRIAEQRTRLAAELVAQRQQWQIEAAESSVGNQWALKTMPDIARSAEQAVAEQMVAGAIGLGVGAAIGTATGAVIATAGASTIFPFAAGKALTAIGAGAGAGAAATAAAAIAIGVVSVVMLVQESDNKKLYDETMARAQTAVPSDLKGFDLSDAKNKAEFSNAFLLAMLEMGGATEVLK